MGLLEKYSENGEVGVNSFKRFGLFIPEKVLKQSDPHTVDAYLMLEIIHRLGGIRLMLRLLFWVPLVVGIIIALAHA